MKHLAPKYHGYKGGFDCTNKCISCSSVGLYEDMNMNINNPCVLCGGRVVEGGVAKWSDIIVFVITFGCFGKLWVVKNNTKDE